MSTARQVDKRRVLGRGGQSIEGHTGGRTNTSGDTLDTTDQYFAGLAHGIELQRDNGFEHAEWIGYGMLHAVPHGTHGVPQNSPRLGYRGHSNVNRGTRCINGGYAYKIHHVHTNTDGDTMHNPVNDLVYEVGSPIVD